MTFTGTTKHEFWTKNSNFARYGFLIKLVGVLSGWLAIWLVDWIDWSIDWLIDWFRTLKVKEHTLGGKAGQPKSHQIDVQVNPLFRHFLWWKEIIMLFILNL